MATVIDTTRCDLLKKIVAPRTAASVISAAAGDSSPSSVCENEVQTFVDTKSTLIHTRLGLDRGRIDMNVQIDLGQILCRALTRACVNVSKHDLDFIANETQNTPVFSRTVYMNTKKRKVQLAPVSPVDMMRIETNKGKRDQVIKKNPDAMLIQDQHDATCKVDSTFAYFSRFFDPYTPTLNPYFWHNQCNRFNSARNRNIFIVSSLNLPELTCTCRRQTNNAPGTSTSFDTTTTTNEHADFCIKCFQKQLAETYPGYHLPKTKTLCYLESTYAKLRKKKKILKTPTFAFIFVDAQNRIHFSNQCGMTWFRLCKNGGLSN